MRAIVEKYIDRRTESEGNRRLVQKTQEDLRSIAVI